MSSAAGQGQRGFPVGPQRSVCGPQTANGVVQLSFARLLAMMLQLALVEDGIVYPRFIDTDDIPEGFCEVEVVRSIISESYTLLLMLRIS